MIKSIGECDLEGHDDANIPCNIFIKALDTDDDLLEQGTDELDEDDEDNEMPPRKEWAKFELTADLFMPRKGLADGVIHYLASTKEELAQLVKEMILPSYKIAFDAITAMGEGKRDNFYYWNEPGD